MADVIDDELLPPEEYDAGRQFIELAKTLCVDSGYIGTVDLDERIKQISDRVEVHVPNNDGETYSVGLFWSSNDILILLAKIVQLQGEVERIKTAYTKLEKDFREELDQAIWEHEMGEDL